MTHPLLQSLFDETERRPLSVTELTAQVRASLESRFRSVWVEGEISNFKIAASGHWYFTIKDEFAQLRASCFARSNRAIRFRPSDGLQVRARGRLTVYEPRGDYELMVEGLDPVGAGALRVAFEQLRERLATEGLFDEDRKRPVPIFPRRVGVVTSPAGAAIRDILNVLTRRTRTVHILLAPTRVQGEGAGAEISSAIELLNEHNVRALAEGREEDAVDVIIVARGGGSAEDLWAFNDEQVARAIATSSIPVISGVGHETDFTITDFAADVRAATPSAAAELVAEREDDLELHVHTLTRDMVRALREQVTNARVRVQDAAMSRGFDDVRSRLHDSLNAANAASHRLEILINRAAQRARKRVNSVACRLSPARLSSRLAAARTRFSVLTAARDAAAQSLLDDARSRLAVGMASLDALSPLAVLGRGYALAYDEEGRLLRDSGEVEVDDRVRLRLARGSIGCRVLETEKN